jgi:hypothetical protein
VAAGLVLCARWLARTPQGAAAGAGAGADR